MAALTANDFAQQIIAQARILDPSFSAEVGTPERKIIDTVAQALADNQIDLTGLQGALDIDSKFGSNLDRFTALFGFQRQQSTAATGYVVFSRITPAPTDVTISQGVVIQSNASSVQYTTTASGTIIAGDTTSGAIPVQAVVTGTVGNAAAHALTIITGTTVPGVTAVTNPNPLNNGLDPEDDNSLKVRFKNTWARNLAGTQDQFLALAVTGTFTTKANVIGMQSQYQEYVQVPDADDAGFGFGAYTVDQDTLGVQGQWTTAFSSIPYAKQIYSDVPTFMSNGQQGLTQFFYRSGMDYTFNVSGTLPGDASRETRTIASGTQTVAPGGTLNVDSVTGFPPTGTLLTNNSVSVHQITYTGIVASPPSFTGCSACTVTDDSSVYFIPPIPPTFQPNFTLLNVYNPSVPATIDGLQAVSPGDVLLTEFSYVSSASRNDLHHNVINAVDVYLDGHNDVQSSCVFLANTANQIFNTNPNSPWYYENYRRDGLPTKRPQLGNYITPLFQSPLSALPHTIIIGNENYYLGTHYWLVHERDLLGGSIRARDGVEWSNDLLGDTGSFPAPTDPLARYYPTGGANISALGGSAVEVNDYLYDANIVALQASMETARQVNTDVLVHQANLRYFKLDITVIYSPNTNFAVTNATIGTAVQAFMDRQYFGTVIQLSTLLEIIHEVTGVENVRWSNDLPIVPNLIRVYETDVSGQPLHGASIDRHVVNPGTPEQHSLYIAGEPDGTFTLTWTDPGNLTGGHNFFTTAPIPFTQADGTDTTAAEIQTAIRAAASSIGIASGTYFNIAVAQDVRPSLNVPDPIRSFTVTYGANGLVVLPSISQTIVGSTYGFDADFFLLDNELPSLPDSAQPGDTVPGIIIRPRAQSTFFRPGLG